MIGFVGLSHLGIISSIAAAAKGFEVVGFDESADLVNHLNRGELPIVEPGLADLLVERRDRLRFTADVSELKACELVYVSIDVPTDDEDRSDVTPVERLLQLLHTATRPDAIIVILSQVPPGFCRARPQSFGQLYYQVETLIFGLAVERALKPERFIVGCANSEQPLAPALKHYLQAFGCPILQMGYESAELCKISINAFLVSAVATTNMLAEICEAVGAEWREIAPALRLDKRIGPHAYLNPGLGIAGGNLRRDLITIKSVAAEHGTGDNLIDVWLKGSDERRDWALREVRARVIARYPSPAIGLWGLAYKENTNSTKHSPAISLIDGLPELSVKAFDPGVAPDLALASRVRRVGSALDACHGADALVIMTAWPEFKAIDLGQVISTLRHPVLIDPWGVADRTHAKKLGFEYVRLGSGQSH